MEKKYRRVTFAKNSKSAIRTSSDVAEDRRKLFAQLLAYNVQLKELQCCREEVDRDLIIETALLGAELDAAVEELRMSNNAIDEMDRALVESQRQIDECAVEMQHLNAIADEKLKRYRQAFHKLRSRLESIEVNLDDDDDADSELTSEIQEAVDKLAALLKAKQKAYDVLEFKLLKEEAAFLGRREVLIRERAAVAVTNRGHKCRVARLQEMLDQVRRDGADQLRKLRADIDVTVLSVRQGYSILEDLNAEAELFAEPSSTAIIKEPSSETDAKFRGYLKKLSSKYSGRLYDSWTKRWFVFDKLSDTLSYYRRKSDEDKPSKSTNFQVVQEVYLNRGYGKKGRQGRVFVVMTDQGTLLLSAATGPEALKWVNTLSCVFKTI